jgi:hypothetical protein
MSRNITAFKWMELYTIMMNKSNSKTKYVKISLICEPNINIMMMMIITIMEHGKRTFLSGETGRG